MSITQSKLSFAALAWAICSFIFSPLLQAQTVTWGGSDGEYTTPANWAGGVLPDTNGGGETALISSGNVTYTPGGDLQIRSGATLQISGGSFTQAGGVSWMQFGGGNLLVDGGSFNQGTAGNFVRDASSTVTISGGSATFSGNYFHDTTSGSLVLSGGIMNIGNEFRTNVAGFEITGGTLAIDSGIAFNGSESVDLTSGSVSVDASWNDLGFFGAGVGNSVNFTTGSTGTLRLRGYDIAGKDFETLLVDGNRLTINGAAATIGDFSTISSGGDLLVTVIPEPSTILMTLMGFGLIGLAVRRRK
jgi:uncharacterized Zn-binding protein involved in type VI secretion